MWIYFLCVLERYIKRQRRNPERQFAPQQVASDRTWRSWHVYSFCVPSHPATKPAQHSPRQQVRNIQQLGRTQVKRERRKSSLRCWLGPLKWCQLKWIYLSCSINMQNCFSSRVLDTLSFCHFVITAAEFLSCFALRNEQYYEAIMGIWNQLYINIKSLISWQHCLKDINYINSLTVTMVRCHTMDSSEMTKVNYVSVSTVSFHLELCLQSFTWFIVYLLFV